jgi:hypothetical protein
MLTPEIFGALYITLVRLAGISAGIVSIICGYRLFVAGAVAVGAGKAQTEVGARVSGLQMTLKSAAPGTCFAFFGAFIIAVLVLRSPPDFSRTQTITTSAEGDTKETQSMRMRGRGGDLAELVEAAKRAEKAQDHAAAIQGYESALRLVAEPLNNLAFLYHQAKRDQEALPLAQLATQFSPHEPQFRDTLNSVRGSSRKLTPDP